jgi:hypothetical protein
LRLYAKSQVKIMTTKHEKQGAATQEYTAPSLLVIEIACEQAILTASTGAPGEDPDVLDWGEF